MQTWRKGHTYTNPRPDQYVTHVLSHITRAVTATDSCFALIGSHHAACQSCWVNEQGRGEPASEKPHTAEVCAKQSIKRQLHTTHVGAVGWEPHSSSTTTCAGKVDHELPVKARGTHTPNHGLAITSRSHGHLFRPYWGYNAKSPI